MTREILFRGKREDNGEWAEGFLARPHSYNNGVADTYMLNEVRNCITRCNIIVDGETVGQYTGLTDKNGVKIFEGDILKIGNKIRYVFFGVLGFRYTNNGEYAADLTVKIAANSEVIGNIHDNPELLEARE